MAKLSEEQIKEIAEQIDMGLKCHWNKKTNELIFIPEQDLLEIDPESWEEELNKLDEDPDNFITIERPESRHSFKIMESFIESIPDSPLKDNLRHSLNYKKPFRAFKDFIDNAGEYRQAWFDFKSQKLQEWVRDRVESEDSE
jgi:hypothetical protein